VETGSAQSTLRSTRRRAASAVAVGRSSGCARSSSRAPVRVVRARWSDMPATVCKRASAASGSTPGAAAYGCSITRMREIVSACAAEVIVPNRPTSTRPCSHRRTIGRSQSRMFPATAAATRRALPVRVIVHNDIGIVMKIARQILPLSGFGAWKQRYAWKGRAGGGSKNSDFLVDYDFERRLERPQHLDHLGEYPRIRGHDLAAAQIAAFAGQVANQAAGLDDQQAAGRHVPGIEPHLP